MSGLAGLLAGHVQPGVYRWHAAFGSDDVAHTAQVAGWAYAHLDAHAIDTKTDALAALGSALGFPQHYGLNLDALHDCLRDLDGPRLLLWDSWGPLAWADRSAFDRILTVLGRRAAEGGFAVVLRGDGPEVDLPSLD